jgi:hypothetical protein
MSFQTWRRFHADKFTANVVEKGPGSYAVVVWDQASGLVRELPRIFARLESAKAAADDLARRTFGHRCTLEHCGEWLVWSV